MANANIRARKSVNNSCKFYEKKIKISDKVQKELDALKKLVEVKFLVRTEELIVNSMKSI